MSEIYQLKAPHIGEGVHYAKVVRFLKNLGDWVEEDSDVVEVETDKAVLGVSTPVSGFISNVFCQSGDTVNIGSVLLEIADKKIVSVASTGINLNQKRKGDILKEPPDGPAVAASLPNKQFALIQHMRDSQNIIITASIESRLNWEKIDAIKKAMRSQKDIVDAPSSLEIICWAVSQAMFKFEKFRSRMSQNYEIQTNEGSLIGIAVSNKDGTFDTPIISLKKNNNFLDVQETVRSSLRQDKKENGFVSGYHSISISDMSSFETIRAQPVVVYPSVATLFIGTPYWAMMNKSQSCRYSNIVLAFDHRLINGVYAAKFLKQINRHVQQLADEVSSSSTEGDIENDTT